MYRIFCESYENFKKDFYQVDSRSELTVCFSLLSNPERYATEKKAGTPLYMEANELLQYLKDHPAEYPRTVSLLWTMESRGIIPEKSQPKQTQRLHEQAKLITSFMRLAYWQ